MKASTEELKRGDLIFRHSHKIYFSLFLEEFDEASAYVYESFANVRNLFKVKQDLRELTPDDVMNRIVLSDFKVT